MMTFATLGQQTPRARGLIHWLFMFVVIMGCSWAAEFISTDLLIPIIHIVDDKSRFLIQIISRLDEKDQESTNSNEKDKGNPTNISWRVGGECRVGGEVVNENIILGTKESKTCKC